MAANNHRLLIKNAHVYDPGRGIDYQGDLAIFKDRIVEALPDDGTNLMIIDAEGDWVVPGLIDYHAHVGFGSTAVGFPTDLVCLSNGVTTVLDGGTRGASNMDQMCRQVIPSAITTVKCLLNFSDTGISSLKYAENINPKYFDVEQMRFMIEKYPDAIAGLKIRIMKEAMPDYKDTGMEPLRRAVEIASELGQRLHVHFTDPPGSYAEALTLLRPGDVFVHPYQGMGTTILSKDGTIDQAVFDAKKRGVLVDLAGARIHQSYVVARAAIAQGFVPDIYSTDLARDAIFMKPVFSLPYILSAYRNLGIAFKDLIIGSTTTPAKLLGISRKRGTLAVGASADITILKEKNVQTVFTDWFGNSFVGNTLYKPLGTIKDGRLYYLDMEVKQKLINKLSLV